MQDRREHFLTAPILPLLIKTAIPTMIGMLITMIYNLTDTYFVGMLNDKSMTASIGLVYSIVSIVQAFGFWFGYGSGNTMSRCLGAKDTKEAHHVASDGVLLSVIVGAILSVVIFIFRPAIAAFLVGNGSVALLGYTMEYMGVIIVSITFSMISTCIYNQLRLCGNVKDGMIGLLSGIITNMILDPILILGFRMGVLGAGYATLIGQIIGSIILLFLSYKHGNIPIKISEIALTKSRIYHILAGGAPNFSRQGITSLATFLLNRQAALYGDEMIAAFTIATRITALAYLLMIGFGQGFQPICGINYGAKKYDRVHTAFKYATSIGTAFLCVATIIMAFFAENFSALMISNEEVINISAKIIRFQCISLPFIGIYALSSMYMQNIGRYMTALFISVLRQGLFFLPLILLLPYLFGEIGLFITQPIADILSIIVSIGILSKEFHRPLP